MRRAVAENIINADLALFQLIFGWNGHRYLDSFFRLVTRSGDAWAYAIIGSTILFISIRDGSSMVIAAVAAFSTELLVYKLLKRAFRRARPFDHLKGIRNLVAAPDRYSFPSGHTAAAFVTASMLTVCLPILLLPAFSWALLIGISRIYLGVHYPTDVLAGLVLGLLSAQAGLFMVF